MDNKEFKFGRRSFLKASGVTAAAAAFTAYAGLSSAPTADACIPNLFSGASSDEIVFSIDSPIVQIESGRIRGFVDNGIYTFRGVPYASASRFELPHKPDAWSGIRNTVIYGGMCPQVPMTVSDADILNPHTFWPMDENCLKLNVWSNNLTGKKPVMFWIHGGGYSTGSCIEQPCYDGHNLCEKGDVVVVSINHRLNSLGFLDLSAYGEEYKYSGNLGMLDIVAALEWVRDNIAQFGGDPGNVTVFGQSGGGRKILNLLAMPSAGGLFHKCICQSCGPSGVTPADAQLVAKLTFEELNIPEGDVEALAALDYEKLRIASEAAQTKATAQLGHSVGWYPVVDGDCLPANIWIGDGIPTQGSDIPMIIGSCFGELTTNALSVVLGGDGYKNTWDEATVDQKLTAAYGDKKDAVVAAFKKAYPNKPIVDALFVALAGYRADTKAILKKRAEQAAPVYNYVFSYEFPVLGGILPWHCSDLPFVFGNVSKHGMSNGATKEGHALEDIMLGAWAAFAYTGNPNHKGMIEWPAYTNEGGAAMIFEPNCRIAYHHDDELFSAVMG